jgi:hypothetical protein
MLTLRVPEGQQIPLFHEIHDDDRHLLNTIEGEWFEILYDFAWEDYRDHAVAYYEALHAFNLQARRASAGDHATPGETKSKARQRLLFDRATMQMDQTPAPQIIYQGNVVEFGPPKIDPRCIAPGVVPLRLAGRKPKCFFSLLKSFIGASLMGFPSEPEQVHLLLKSNPSFARVCGFGVKEKGKSDRYDYRHIPGLRKLEQFDQVMRAVGLWDRIKVAEVKRNIEAGVIKAEHELVGDTTHYHARSGFETVVYADEKGRPKKKSQSKVTKHCHCPEWSTCAHQWVLADDGAGTIVKSGTKRYWGHKASIVGLPRQGIALDAVAVMDAATHDGQTFFPHVEKVFAQYPEITGSIKRVLYDSACDDDLLKKRFKDKSGVDLKASFNPRRAKAVTEDLPRGMEKITPYGVPVCLAGHEMDYRGIRYDSEKFIFQAPRREDGTSVCIDCGDRLYCCNRSTRSRSSQSGRTITVSFDTLPQIDANDPPMAKRFKAIMTRRPSVERMIKRLKCDLGDDRLGKRGNESFQAYLDKTMIGYHLLIRHLR